MGTRDISKLEQKAIGVFIALGCNVGKPVKGGDNFIQALMKAQPEIGVAIASHGYMVTAQVTDKDRTYVRIYSTIGRRINEMDFSATGFRVFTRSNSDPLTPSPVTSIAIGAVNDVYIGVSDLIRKALIRNMLVDDSFRLPNINRTG